MEHIIWNQKAECASRQEIQELQLQRLKHIVNVCYERIPFYRNQFDSIGLKPSHINTLKDIQIFPLPLQKT
jgi:phenylacetate-CoA ligase